MERCSDDVVHDQGAEEASMGAKRHSFRPFSEAAPSTPLWRGIVIQFLSVGSETITTQVVAESADNEEPLTFEVGTQQFMGNPLFQGIDEAVRGLAVGQSALVQASGGEYNPDLLFQVRGIRRGVHALLTVVVGWS